MNVYEFCSRSFSYKKINIFKFLKKFYILFIVFGISISYLSILTFQTFFLPDIPLNQIPQIKDKYEKILIAEKANEFSEEKFVAKIKELNIKHPHIALAQAYLESGMFTSKMFKENNNMFGMKEARSRINLAQGTQYNHAYFESWEDCLLDYAYYRATYTSKLKTEQQFYTYLGNYYAEDPNYVSKLKNMVNRYNLKSKFK